MRVEEFLVNLLRAKELPGTGMVEVVGCVLLKTPLINCHLERTAGGDL